MSLDLYLEVREPVEHHVANITHNLVPMAKEAGIYEALWHPHKARVRWAGDLIGPLSTGLKLLESNPERFRALNPANGWGNYDVLVSSVRAYLKACEEYPDAIVRACA